MLTHFRHIMRFCFSVGAVATITAAFSTSIGMARTLTVPHRFAVPPTVSGVLYVSYYNDVDGNYDVVAFSRSGSVVESFPSTYNATLIATDRLGNLWMLDTGTGTVSGYAPGHKDPFKTVSLASGPLYNGAALAVDRLGQFWVAVGCSGMYCGHKGSLTEYSSSGSVKRTFPNCLHDYRSIAVHFSGNAFAAGVRGLVHGSYRHVGLVEFPAGSTSCRDLQDSRELGNQVPSIQVTPKGNLVVDLGSVASNDAELETLARPLFEHVLYTTQMQVEDGYYSVAIALTDGGQHIWNANTYTNYYTEFSLFNYPAGGVPIVDFNVGHLGGIIGIAAPP